MLSSRRVELLDNDQMVREFRRLERKRGRGGKDSIQDGGRHDDLVNAICGVIGVLMSKPVMSKNAVPTGVGKGIGYELEKLGGGLGRPMFSNDSRLSRGTPVQWNYNGDGDDDEPSAKVHEIFRFRWNW